MKTKMVIYWFRRDLRLEDNVGLSKALASGFEVLPIFIFDKEILNQLPNYDRRVDYIQQALAAMDLALKKNNSGILTFFDTPALAFENLSQKYNIEAVYCNHDYEPKAMARDQKIKDFLAKNHIDFLDFKDQVIFEKSEIVKDDAKPYTVYTPYAKKWRLALKPDHLKPQHINSSNFYQFENTPIKNLEDIGFEKTDLIFEKPTLSLEIIKEYDKYRDFPALNHTTQLGIALRFGTISVRECVYFAQKHNDIWLSELIWREFFMQILYHFPKVVDWAFKSQYDTIEWRNDETDFQRWCNGETGYPIVDAGMRQLNKTGFMHNRVRMIVASFLCKHLLIDWRWGEAYFAQKLNDYDLAANNGNWQWAAGSGCDASPYFRVFNPSIQTKKFDAELKYIRKWNPEFSQSLAPCIVEHEFARERALKTYKKALDKLY